MVFYVVRFAESVWEKNKILKMLAWLAVYAKHWEWSLDWGRLKIRFAVGRNLGVVRLSGII
ncbi:hypothetical protein l11_05740 [Neisseria weaveri LMG 5135]|nr:hypothetical protein l13_13920 [Neisseria weaveri ATCC 51223]EGV38250.1 hypothetical protein l11_05740 [Neisseria weaveri LMG 5135]